MTEVVRQLVWVCWAFYLFEFLAWLLHTWNLSLALCVYIQECEKAVKAAAFAAAIQTEETMPLSETVNVDNIVVEASYDGPRLDESGAVTPEFLDALIRKSVSRRPKYSLLIICGSYTHI